MQSALNGLCNVNKQILLGGNEDEDRTDYSFWEEFYKAER
jgi:hypothetical protein